MRKVSLKTLEKFLCLSSFVEDNSFDFDDVISNLITSHLETMKTGFTIYFPNICKPVFDLVRNVLVDKLISLMQF